MRKKTITSITDIHGLPFVDLIAFDINAAVAQILDEKLARSHRAIILEDLGDTYRVGVVDPHNLPEQDHLAFVLGRRLEIAVVDEKQLAATLDRVYSSGDRLNQYAKAVETDVDRDRKVIDINQVTVSVSDPDAPVVKLLQNIFKDAANLGASDIHIEPQEKRLVVRFRIDGVLQTRIEADLKIAPPLMVKLKLMADLDIAEKRLPQDGRISIQTGARELDIRLSTMPTQFGESMVMRILVQSQGMRDLEALGMPEAIYQQFTRIISIPHGIILATGPTGSGKTTTLYGALSRLNSPEVKILSVEDPIEYRLQGVNQVQVNEKIGLSFPQVLRSFLRQDPDILLVGEIRDAETAEIATRAAMTGHLVFSSLHTNDAISAPSRLIDMGVPGFLVASTLRGVLSQRLVRLNCDHCLEPDKPSQDELDWVGRYVNLAPKKSKLLRGRGCQHCAGQGYRGRVGVFQFLEISRPLAGALHDGDLAAFEAKAQELIGQYSLSHQSVQLALEGRTTIAEAMRNTIGV